MNDAVMASKRRASVLAGYFAKMTARPSSIQDDAA
jgi:hypothetical protein